MRKIAIKKTAAEQTASGGDKFCLEKGSELYNSVGKQSFINQLSSYINTQGFKVTGARNAQPQGRYTEFVLQMIHDSSRMTTGLTVSIVSKRGESEITYMREGAKSFSALEINDLDATLNTIAKFCNEAKANPDATDSV